MTEPMTEQVTSDKVGAADLIRVVGDVDLITAPIIGRDIVSRLTGSGAMVLDLTSVSFLDSAGVRLLDALVGDLDDHGTAVRLVVGERSPARAALTLCAFRDELLAVDLGRAADELGR